MIRIWQNFDIEWVLFTINASYYIYGFYTFNMECEYCKDMSSFMIFIKKNLLEEVRFKQFCY